MPCAYPRLSHIKDLLTKEMKIGQYLLLLAFLVPVLVLRDFTPNNELKYLSIADEALRDGHFFTFYNHGEVYADKPPLYFWLLMGSRLLLGEWRMWALALFSALPALGCVAVMNRWTRPQTDKRGRWGASIMLLSSAMFIGSGIVLRMDMLMCLFILLALRTFYRMHSGEGKRRDGVLLPVWIFLAIFTKGPVGFIAPVLSIIVFLALRKEWRQMGRYLGWRTWGILVGLCAVWFGCVYAEGGNEYLNNLLFHQTLDRASDSFHHKEPLWYYCMAYWYSLAPWSILYATVIIIALRKRLLKTDLEKFFLTVIATVFVVMSLFSAKLDIYLLPIFPFFPYLTAVLLPRMRGNWVAWTVYAPVVVFIAAPFALLGMGGVPGMPESGWVTAAGWMLAAYAVMGLTRLLRRDLRGGIEWAGLGVLAALCLGGLGMPKINPFIGYGAAAERAMEIAAEEGTERYYFYRFRSGENMDAYIGKPLTKLTEPAELRAAHSQGDGLILLKEKDARRNPEVGEWLRTVPHEQVGNIYLLPARREAGPQEGQPL